MTAGARFPAAWPLFRDRMRVHVLRQWPAYILLGACAYLLQANYILGWNLSPSLPGRVFLIHKGEPAGKGDLVAFRWNGRPPYRKGMVFIKRIEAVTGDLITADGREIRINTIFAAGTAKPVSRTGEPLEMLPVPVEGRRLQRDEFYVRGEHVDSLDSRYAMVGLLHGEDFVGRARLLF